MPVRSGDCSGRAPARPLPPFESVRAMSAIDDPSALPPSDDTPTDEATTAAEPAGDDAPPTPTPGRAPRLGARISGIQLAVAVVGLMAGAALFLSGYSLGRLAA